MKNLQFYTYQCKARQGWGRVGRIRSIKFKPIPTPPYGAGLKFRPILALPPL